MRRQSGFTLLEMLVATAVMGIAVVGLLANISASMRNAGRLTAHERAVALAHQKMDELLLDPRLPKQVTVEGKFDESQTGGVLVGWRAHVSPFEMPPNAVPGMTILERLELEVWWNEGGRRTLKIDTYRRGIIPMPEQAQ